MTINSPRRDFPTIS